MVELFFYYAIMICMTYNINLSQQIWYRFQLNYLHLREVFHVDN